MRLEEGHQAAADLLGRVAEALVDRVVPDPEVVAPLPSVPAAADGDQDDGALGPVREPHVPHADGVADGLLRGPWVVDRVLRVVEAEGVHEGLYVLRGPVPDRAERRHGHPDGGAHEVVGVPLVGAEHPPVVVRDEAFHLVRGAHARAEGEAGVRDRHGVNHLERDVAGAGPLAEGEVAGGALRVHAGVLLVRMVGRVPCPAPADEGRAVLEHTVVVLDALDRPEVRDDYRLKFGAAPEHEVHVRHRRGVPSGEVEGGEVGAAVEHAEYDLHRRGVPARRALHGLERREAGEGDADVPEPESLGAYLGEFLAAREHVVDVVRH